VSNPDTGTEPSRWPVRLLIVGWNSLGMQLLTQLDPIASPGSCAEIVYDPRLFEVDELSIPETERIAVTLTASKDAVWQIGARTLDPDLTSILVLGYRRGVSIADADSRTLVNLMVLRRDLDEQGPGSTRLIVELLDAQNVELARGMGANDYVVSDAIASRLMAQVAEQPERRMVFRKLYASEGASVNLVQAADLGLSGQTAFGDVVATAYSNGLLAIGWRNTREEHVVLNPDRSEQADLVDGDQIVVIG
jgi:hypothetical protein